MGGGNRVFIELANQLVMKGVNVEIIVPNNSINDFTINRKIKLNLIGNEATTNIKKLSNLIKAFYFLFKKKDSLVVYSDPIIAIFMFKSKKPRFYRFIQADDFCIYDDGFVLKYKLYIWIYKALCKLSFKRAENFIFNSEFTYYRFKEVSKRNDVPKIIIHPAINHTDFFPHTVSRNTEKVTLGLFVRNHPLKGFNIFLNVWNNLPEDIIDGIEVILVSKEQVDIKEFKHVCEIINPSNSFEVASILSRLDIFIYTSFAEGFGLPPLEAMACGASVISSKCGGIDDYTKENINCLLYNPYSITELSNCIKHLVKNGNFRNILSQQGIATAKTFTWHNSSEKLKKILFCNP